MPTITYRKDTETVTFTATEKRQMTEVLSILDMLADKADDALADQIGNDLKALMEKRGIIEKESAK